MMVPAQQEITGRRLSIHEADTRDLASLRRIFDSEVPHVLYMVPYMLYMVPCMFYMLPYILYLLPYISYMVQYILYIVPYM
jgi:hypothetical protein